MSDELKLLSIRLPKVIREHEVLRISAIIREKSSIESADRARRDVLAWAQNRCGGRLQPEAWDLEGFEYFSGGKNSVGVRIKANDADVRAIRADDPDKSVAGRKWTNEIVIGLALESDFSQAQRKMNWPWNRQQANSR